MAKCSCAIGMSGRCGHICGLLYQLAHFKMTKTDFVPEDVAKTQLPQTWHKPRGQQIRPVSTDQLSIRSAKNQMINVKPVTTTLYNPIVTPLPPLQEFINQLSVYTGCLLPTIFEANAPLEVTKFGNFPRGSPLSYQQASILAVQTSINIPDIAFPVLPVRDLIGDNSFNTVLSAAQQENFLSLHVTQEQVKEIEASTRDQASNPRWHKLRAHRLTASKISEVSKAMDTFHRDLVKKSDDPKVHEKPKNLAQRLQSGNFRTTKSMRAGVENEPIAAEHYLAEEAGSVNIYPVGIIIHPKAFWLAASPDRRVYDPSSAEKFGLLEIKCPDMEKKSCLDEVEYLVKNDHKYLLKRSHTHFYQIQMQMAVTGLPWTDLYCWSDKITHLERIDFDADFWSKVKLNIDEFYFSFFL